MMTTNTDFTTCEALTTPLTARQYVERHDEDVLNYAADLDKALAGITSRAHEEAARLGVPHSADGRYPAAIWALEATRNC